MHFIYFSCLIALARTSSTMLIRSGKCGHPCLVSKFSSKFFKLSPIEYMLAVGFSHMTFIVLGYVSSISNLLGFYHERMLNFVKCFSCIY